MQTGFRIKKIPHSCMAEDTFAGSFGLALIPGFAGDPRGAQDEQGRDIFGKRVATMWPLDEANKNRYHGIASSCFWPSPAAQAAGKTDL